MTEFNIRLCELVAEKGMSWSELCRLTGLSSARISQYKTGQYIPKADGLQRIAAALNVNPDYLMGNSEYRDPWPNYKNLEDLTPFELRLLTQFQRADENVKKGICYILGIDTKGKKLKMQFTKEFTEEEIEKESL